MRGHDAVGDESKVASALHEIEGVDDQPVVGIVEQKGLEVNKGCGNEEDTAAGGQLAATSTPHTPLSLQCVKFLSRQKVTPDGTVKPSVNHNNPQHPKYNANFLQ